MLLIIETSGRTCITEIVDGSYDAISSAFSEIGRPELVAKGLTDKTPLEIGKELDLYDWDDLAPLVQGHTMNINDMFNTDGIDSVGQIHIVEDKFVWINGDVEN